jgi:arginine utilization protein RocB
MCNSSELGNDCATIMTTLQEQSEQIQKLEEIIKEHTAQQAKIVTLIEEKMAARQRQHEDELEAQQLAEPTQDISILSKSCLAILGYT